MADDNDDDNSKLSTRMKSGPSLWKRVLCMSQIYMRLQSLILRSYLIVNGHGMIIIDNTSCEVFKSMEIMALRAQADVVLVYLVYAG